MKYNPIETETKWQKYWADNKTFTAQNNSEKPKYYVLDMFPYPSGAGLHVGHPLGYIASDIYARFKKHQGFNVLHPMGYDSFGLPAEQYAIQTGQHPQNTTTVNITRYREQLDKLGLSFDWDREIRTSDPKYYKHTQWIFIQLFNSWYNKNIDKAQDISTLTNIFEKEGNVNINAACDKNISIFSSHEWKNFSSDEKDKILMKYRLTYVSERDVNWCAEFLTVLANDEITNGFSKRGNFPVVKKKMMQWSMRITAYADRLLKDLDSLEWSDSIKQIQINWINNIDNPFYDAVFSRQRYWGEPFPVYYVNGLPQMIDEKYLPIILPQITKYSGNENGQSPLVNAEKWAWDIKNSQMVNTDLINNETIFPMELNTMPGWAGSSWYWMRYMDPYNQNEFASKKVLDYWQNVDLYIGGSEHATGHLLYARFWNKFLKDKGFIQNDEPFKKLVNQGMILGMSAMTYIIYLNNNPTNIFISKNLIPKDGNINNALKELILNKLFYGKSSNITFKIFDTHINTDYIDENNNINFEKLNKSNDFRFQNFEKNAIKDSRGNFEVERIVEKMSKSKYNVVTPDDVCNEYGADTLRLYEMFLGPLEQTKPWNTAGISGVFKFLKKLCHLYFNDNGLVVNNNEPTINNLKILNKTIKKVTQDIESFSFNTSVSQFMICVNELSAQNCHSRAVLEPLAVLISPYAPHIAEELWSLLGHNSSISTVAFPVYKSEYLVENSKEYPVTLNGKLRFTIELPLDLTKTQIEELIMKDQRTIKQLNGKVPSKIIVVIGKIINLID